MQYIEHEKLAFALSKIVFGGAALSGDGKGYGFGEIGESNAQKLIEYSLAKGINCFDTAPIYGYGKSEKRLGKHLRKCREKVFINSKSGITWHSNSRVNLTNDPVICEKMLHQSLRDLETDYIDLYFIHWPDPRVDIRKPMEILAKAKLDQKIKHIGLSNTHLEDYAKACEIDDILFIQGESNLFNHQLAEFYEVSKRDKIITQGWGTFDKGILAGSVSKDQKFSPEDARSWAPWWKKSAWKDKVEKVSRFKTPASTSIKSLSLAYSLLNNDQSICGYKSIEHLHQLLELIDQPPEKEAIERAYEYFNSK